MSDEITPGLKPDQAGVLDSILFGDIPFLTVEKTKHILEAAAYTEEEIRALAAQTSEKQ